MRDGEGKVLTVVATCLTTHVISIGRMEPNWIVLGFLSCFSSSFLSRLIPTKISLVDLIAVQGNFQSFVIFFNASNENAPRLMKDRSFILLPDNSKEGEC